MAFESLTDKLSTIFKKIKGQARITESNIEEMLKEEISGTGAVRTTLKKYLA